MINNTDTILAQTNGKMEEILKNILKEIITENQDQKLTLDSAEKIIGNAIKVAVKVIKQMVSGLLNNISKEDDLSCECCKKKLRINKKSVPLSLMTLYGKLTIVRDELYCRNCGVGRGVNDNILNINKKHRITKGFLEIVTYTGQLIASFKEGQETIKKFIGFMEVDINASQIQIITEETGKKVFEQDKLKAEKIYAEPEKHILDLLEKDKKQGTTYTLVDGSQVNTRVHENGSSWKEMKLVEGFCDKDIIKRKNGDSIITKKEYGAIFGSVESFRKEVLRVAIKTGYGSYKEHVMLGDGAPWIWNMSKELFPNAIEILDFYHSSENTYEYAKVLYPNDEINRARWVNTVLDMLISGKEDDAIEFVNTSKIDKDKLPKGIVNLPEYFENNRTRIRYEYFTKLGYYIGSGAIESGNKTVIQQRMKQAGMLWSVKGGQYIATLRSKYKSGLWNDVVKIIAS